jgi:hypothetical protein
LKSGPVFGSRSSFFHHEIGDSCTEDDYHEQNTHLLNKGMPIVPDDYFVIILLKKSHETIHIAPPEKGDSAADPVSTDLRLQVLKNTNLKNQ